MANYFLTQKAVEDLTEIWNYTFDQWSEEQADKYYLLIIDNCKKIAKNPNLGKNHEGLITDLFGLKINRHVIFYRKLRENEVEITRILHGRMDLKSRVTR